MNGAGKRPLIIVFLATCFWALITSSETPGEHLAVKVFTTADGLAHQRVRRIVRDSHGFLWFCTVDGLSRFDGYRFTTYRKEEGLPSSIVNDLCETSQGVYWIATEDGLSRYDPLPETPNAPIASHFKTYRVGTEPGDNRVRSLLQDSSGRLWIGTARGLYQLQETSGPPSFVKVEIGDQATNLSGPIVRTIKEDEQGTLWIGSTAGLSRLAAGNKLTNYRFGNEASTSVHAVLPDRNGLIWFGADTELVAFRPSPAYSHSADVQTSLVQPGDGKELGLALSSLTVGHAVYLTISTRADNAVRALYQTVDRHVWISTGGAGALEYDGQRLHHYDEAQGLVGNAINTFSEDSDGNLWFGSDTGGALKLTRNGFTGYFKEDGLGHPWIGSIFEQGPNDFYVLSGEDYINQFDGRRFTNIRLAFRRSSSGVFRGGLRDHLGEWWIATPEGLARFPRIERLSELLSARPRIYTERDGLAAGIPAHLFEDARGNVWVFARANDATNLSCWERETAQWRRYGADQGVPSFNRVFRFVEDQKGALWTTFDQGKLARRRDQRFELVEVSKAIEPGQIEAIHIDNKGRLWVMTPGTLYWSEDLTAQAPTFSALPLAKNLELSDVNCMTSDLDGRLYFGTSRGIVRLDPSNQRSDHYTIADGLCNNEVSGAFRDRHGVLWFATLDGLARFSPETQREVDAPLVFIGGLRIEGVPYSMSELGMRAVSNLELSASQTQIQIDFFAPEFHAGEMLRYQYTLEGADKGWSEPTEQRTVNYARLAPGTYRFLVRAVKADGRSTSQPAFVSFRIAPPVWQRWWFLTLVVLLLSGAAYSLYHYRVRQLLALERVRTRIATDLHDDIGASLSRVAILSEVVRRQNPGNNRESEERLAEIANSARELVDSMSDIVWSVDPRRDDLGNVVTRLRQFGADVLETQNINWELQVTPDLEKTKLTPEQRSDIFLICKEALNNAARHAGCRHATLSLRLSGSQILVEIRDDGRGFPVPEGPHFEKRRVGHGLANMQARAQRLGGSLAITSNRGGTQLNLSIPLHGRR